MQSGTVRKFIFLSFLCLGTAAVYLLSAPSVRAMMCCSEVDGYYQEFRRECYAGPQNYPYSSIESRAGCTNHIHIVDLTSCLACADRYRNTKTCDPGC